MQVHAYLFFNGCCEEAVQFYQRALGAQVDMLMRFSESPDTPPPGMVPPGWDNKVMHTSFHIGDTMVMASDGTEGQSKFAGFSLSLSLKTAAEVDRMFAALADGGSVQMPPQKTFWSERFGMLTDRSGVSWMVTVAA